jgi:hypothetical protein
MDMETNFRFPLLFSLYGRPGNLPNSVYHLLTVQKDVFVCSSVNTDTNESYPFAKGLNGLNALAYLIQMLNHIDKINISII